MENKDWREVIGRKFGDENNGIGSNQNIIKTGQSMDELKAFLSTSIAQALAEERERMRGKIENAIKYINWSHSVGSHSDDSGGDSDVECTCREDEARYKTEAYKNTLSFLSPLDKPLTVDKDI